MNFRKKFINLEKISEISRSNVSKDIFIEDYILVINIRTHFFYKNADKMT